MGTGETVDMMHIMTEQDKNDFLKIKGWVYWDPNTLEHRIPNDAPGYLVKWKRGLVLLRME